MDGSRSNVMIIGQSFGDAMGSSWKFISFFLGVLGAFFAGSNTVSNLMFSPIQYSIAMDQGLDITGLLALQNSGGAIGNAICVFNIVAACSVLGLSHKEGWILTRAIWPVLLSGVVALLLSLIYCP